MTFSASQAALTPRRRALGALAKTRRTSNRQIDIASFAAALIAVVWCTPVHSEEVYFHKFIGNERFAVPKQYLHPRPIGDQGGKCPSCAFGIQFWIPDLSAPENDLFFKPEFRPSEASRPLPTPGEFVVKFTSIQYVGQTPKPDINTAETRIVSTLSRYDKEKFILQPYGKLTRFFSKNSPNGPQSFYARRSGGSILMFCAANDEKQICQGFADIPEYEVTSRFHLPISEIHNYGLIVEGISTLLGKWNVK